MNRTPLCGADGLGGPWEAMAGRTGAVAFELVTEVEAWLETGQGQPKPKGHSCLVR